MIIYDPRSYQDVVFRLRGSVIPTIFIPMLCTSVVAFFCCWRVQLHCASLENGLIGFADLS